MGSRKDRSRSHRNGAAKPPNPRGLTRPTANVEIESAKTKEPTLLPPEQPGISVPSEAEPSGFAAWMKTWSPIVLNALILIVIMGHAFYYQKQWDTMKDTLKESRTEHKESLRPWVAIVLAELDEPILTAKHRLQVKLRFKNAGNTPALNATEETYYGVLPIGGYDVPQSETGKSSPLSTQAILLSGFEFKCDGDIPFSPLEILSHSAGDEQGRLHIFGYINYDDAWGCQHSSRFCFYNGDPSTTELRFCPTGNSVHDEPCKAESQTAK